MNRAGKVYFSEIQNPDKWEVSPHFKFILIPSNWWSLKAWRLAIEVRKNVSLAGFIKEPTDER